MMGRFDLTVMQSNVCVCVSLSRSADVTSKPTVSLEAFGIISLRNFVHEVLSPQQRLFADCRRITFQDPNRTFMHPCAWNAVNQE